MLLLFHSLGASQSWVTKFPVFLPIHLTNLNCYQRPRTASAPSSSRDTRSAIFPPARLAWLELVVLLLAPLGYSTHQGHQFPHAKAQSVAFD